MEYNEQHEQKCDHPPCACKASGASDYCSDACRDADDEQLCACGHPDCEAAAAAAA